MKKLLVLAILLIFAGSLIAQEQSQKPKEKKAIETKAVKIEKARGANPEIKTPKPTDDKIVEKSRGPVYPGDCDIVIENHTGYTIDIYVDGNYRGTIGAWEERVTWAIPGKTKFYAESIGGTAAWGAYWFECDYEYTWRLWP